MEHRSTAGESNSIAGEPGPRRAAGQDHSRRVREHSRRVQGHSRRVQEQSRRAQENREKSPQEEQENFRGRAEQEKRGKEIAVKPANFTIFLPHPVEKTGLSRNPLLGPPRDTKNKPENWLQQRFLNGLALCL